MAILETLNKKIAPSTDLIVRELSEVVRRHALMVSWVAIVVYPFWGVLDFLFAEGHWVQFLLMRISQSVAIGIVIFFTVKNKVRVEVLNYVVTLGIALQISYMCTVVPEGALLTYFLGFSTLFIASNLLMVWHPFHPLLILLLTLVSYPIFFMLNSTVPFVNVIKNGGLLFLTISTTSVFVAWLHYTFRRKDVISRIEIEESSRELKKAYREITDNLHYAKRIQDAVLSKNERVKKVFNDYFVMLRPKGVVSGDFYWASDFEFYRKTGKVAVAAVDCTGHGISGAFLSFIGETNLHQIVNVDMESSPDRILERLNDNVREMLRQDVGDAQDGMDIALCVIDHRTRCVEFAGAHNPLVYVQNEELKYIKGDRLSIGGRQAKRKKSFTKHTIPLVDEATAFYVFSDGFVDQAGGKYGDKFKIKHFRDLLHTVSDRSMSEQKKELETVFDKWQGDRKQVDDMLVIGFNV